MVQKMIRLTLKQRLALAEYLKNLSEASTNPVSYREAAKRASKDLGFEVTPSHATNVIREADIPWKVAPRRPPKSKASKPPALNDKQLEALVTLAAEMEARVSALEKEVQKLRESRTQMMMRIGSRITALEEKNAAMWKQLSAGGLAAQIDMFTEKEARQ